MRWILGWACIVTMFIGEPAFSARAETDTVGKVMTVVVADPIGPGVAEFLEDAMEKASEAGAACLIIQLDTPGGAVESMRRIVQAIYACQIPVVVYVYPSGARLGAGAENRPSYEHRDDACPAQDPTHAASPLSHFHLMIVLKHSIAGSARTP